MLVSSSTVSSEPVPRREERRVRPRRERERPEVPVSSCSELSERPDPSASVSSSCEESSSASATCCVSPPTGASPAPTVVRGCGVGAWNSSEAKSIWTCSRRRARSSTSGSFAVPESSAAPRDVASARRSSTTGWSSDSSVDSASVLSSSVSAAGSVASGSVGSVGSGAAARR